MSIGIAFLEGRMGLCLSLSMNHVLADNVGDNVGHIAGVGADLSGSFAEATGRGVGFL